MGSWYRVIFIGGLALLATCPGREPAPARTGASGGKVPVILPGDLEVQDAPAPRVIPVTGNLRRLRTVTSPVFGVQAWASEAHLGPTGRVVLLDGYNHRGSGRGWHVALVEPFAGRLQRFDRIVAVSPGFRWAALRRGRKVFLVSLVTAKLTDLSARGADPEGDRSSPGGEGGTGLKNFDRQVSFGPLGRYATYLRKGGAQVVLRNLHTTTERVFFAGRGRLAWRAEPSERPGGVRLFLVKSRKAFRKPYVRPDPKIYKHACGTQLHRRYESMRVTTAQVEILPSGRRISWGQAQGAERVHWLGGGYHLRDQTLLSPWLRAVKLPEIWRPSVPPAYFVGHGKVLFSGSHFCHLFDPAARRVRRIRAPDANAGFGLVYPRSDAAGHSWAHAYHILVDKKRTRYVRQGRLRLSDGQLEWTPFTEDRFAAPVAVYQRWFARTPWVVGVTPRGVYALNVKTAGLYWQYFEDAPGAKHWVIAPAARGYYPTDIQPLDQTVTGCALESTAGRTKIKLGPWRLRCPVGAAPVSP